MIAIKKSKNYQKYGVPIEYIKPLRMTFTKQKTVVMQFGIKGSS